MTEINVETDEVCSQIIQTILGTGIASDLNFEIEEAQEELTSEMGEETVPYLVVTLQTNMELAQDLGDILYEEYPLNTDHEVYMSNYDVVAEGVFPDEVVVVAKFPLKEKYYTGKTYNPQIPDETEEIDDEP